MKHIISKYEAREVKTGKWAWVLVKKLVTWPMVVLQFSFGWILGGNPPIPDGDASDPKARVKNMRGE